LSGTEFLALYKTFAFPKGLFTVRWFSTALPQRTAQTMLIYFQKIKLFSFGLLMKSVLVAGLLCTIIIIGS
jgi:hypothetical protein